eukprot:CAMPEP_0178897802 /NCGR_PEP_ID=MMETSP0786-20121207/1960_1 /TAXON_ID=186022 /ORGANISM="Thalassionema frauenfeldii, Strain CCMP 1798" /LENGTH=490 /DNA_ID=CAMNT_0020568415 /DNA_START=161 /DNA_END=1636 /DNA_ORIENTATION=-
MTQKEEEETKQEEVLADDDDEEYDPDDMEENNNNNNNNIVDNDDNDNNDGDDKVQRIDADAPWLQRYLEVIQTFWPLGLVAFGGPQAHVAILRDHLVTQRGWMDEDQFTELFAIGQGLPGPTSTQLVVSTALSRAGAIGGLTAFFLWNVPGLVVLTVSLWGIAHDFIEDPDNPPFWLAGLPPAAVSLVFKAFYGFCQKLDKLGLCLALVSGLIAIGINHDARIPPTSSQYVFPITLAVGGLITFLDSKRTKPFSSYDKPPSAGWKVESDALMKRIGIPIWVGCLLFVLWAGVLTLTLCLVNLTDMHENVYLEIFELMFRIGSIIFGGDQVVLPLLEDEVVPSWMSRNQFLQGLGLAQSLPGPLFNFSAYLGAIIRATFGVALVVWAGLFGPGVLLIFAMVPLLGSRLRHVTAFRSTLIDPVAIGLFGAACVILWEVPVMDAADVMVFCLSGFLAVVYNVMAPLVVLAGGVLGAILHEDVLIWDKLPYCEA